MGDQQERLGLYMESAALNGKDCVRRAMANVQPLIASAESKCFPLVTGLTLQSGRVRQEVLASVIQALTLEFEVLDDATKAGSGSTGLFTVDSRRIKGIVCCRLNPQIDGLEVIRVTQSGAGLVASPEMLQPFIDVLHATHGLVVDKLAAKWCGDEAEAAKFQRHLAVELDACLLRPTVAAIYRGHQRFFDELVSWEDPADPEPAVTKRRFIMAVAAAPALVAYHYLAYALLGEQKFMDSLEPLLATVCRVIPVGFETRHPRSQPLQASSMRIGRPQPIREVGSVTHRLHLLAG